MPIIVEGKTLAVVEKARIKEEAASFLVKTGYPVGLAVILVGEDPSSKIYVSSKEKACAEVGFHSEVLRLPESTSEAELIKIIEQYNANPQIHGILVQSPPPKHINEERIIEVVSPAKDVDCFHPYNFGRLFAGDPVVEPCTPRGIIKLMQHYSLDIAGKHAVVVGRSNIVGKPIAALLLHRHATVTICHSKTRNLAEITRQADILVPAIGKPNFIKADMVKEGAVVMDVGINRIPDSSSKTGTRITGDVDYEAVKDKCYAITPVPGGVGAMTIAMLLDNALIMAKRSLL